MGTWYVFTGKTPRLSRLELERQLPLVDVRFQSVSSVADGLVQIKSDLPSAAQLGCFGGILRAAVPVTTVPKHRLIDSLGKIISADSTLGHDIGLSCFSGMAAHHLMKMGLAIKKELRLRGRSVRMVFPRESAMLSTVVVQKQLLNKSGAEFVLIEQGPEWIITRTVWVHQFEEWGTREFGRAHVDQKRGMLPNKLARMMINVAGLKTGEHLTVIDPFCGTGVVLQEARELGCQMLGSDIDERAVTSTKQNLGLATGDATILVSDARTVRYPKFPTKQIAVVTEPWLGPVWNHLPDSATLRRVMIELCDLYAGTLRHLRTILPPGTPLVMVFPVIFDSPTWGACVDRIIKLQYSSTIEPIRYERSDQRVTRDIVCLVTH